MRVLQVRDTALEFVTRPEPRPGPREVLVRLNALSLNYRDLLVVNGTGRWRPPEPRIPVSDGVGRVVERGPEATRFDIGDRVTPLFYPRWIDGAPSVAKMQGALGGAGADGLYREYACFDEEAVIAVPGHLSDEEAATLPCAALTAWNAVGEIPRASEERTAVMLGTGGVALFALQFAKAMGWRAIVTSSSDEKLSRARALGADAGINYRTSPNWPAAVRELTNGEGADLVVDSAGELAQSIEAVRVGGRIAFIGLLRGLSAEIDLVKLMGSSATVRAIDVGSRAMFESMNRTIAEHQLRPVIDRTFAFDEAGDAFAYLSSGSHFGKVCVRVY
jgi:NADPH:quinone reductase-like Zn-dependent oxidoreductase